MISIPFYSARPCLPFSLPGQIRERRLLFLFLFFSLSGLAAASLLHAEQIALPLPEGREELPATRLEKPPETELLDIRGPIEIQDNSRSIVIVGAALAAALLLTALITFFRRRTVKQQRTQAHETALTQLAGAQRLIDQGMIDEFVTLIDQTLRIYIEQRFAVSASKQTTREFVERLADNRKPVATSLTKNSAHLQTWLEQCDLVKFAGADLKRESMLEIATNLRSFIGATKVETDR